MVYIRTPFQPFSNEVFLDDTGGAGKRSHDATICLAI